MTCLIPLDLSLGELQWLLICVCTVGGAGIYIPVTLWWERRRVERARETMLQNSVSDVVERQSRIEG